MTTASKKWSDENVATLQQAVIDGQPVSAEVVAALAELLGTTVRSVASKYRQMKIEVASMAVVKAPSFTPAQGEALAEFVEQNKGVYTYKEIAEHFNGGSFSAKQVQGKILALELTTNVKATEKAEAVRQYSDAEESIFVSMAKEGKFIEDIASTLSKTIASIRGKGLSLARQGKIAAIPSQKESHANSAPDAIEALGDAVAKMTVVEIATAIGKTDRGVKTTLTRRGISVADYDGAAKKAKNDAAEAAALAKVAA